MQVLVITRPANRQKILHVKRSRVRARAALRSFIGHQFTTLALECLTALIAHRRPAFRAIEKVPNDDVQRCALARNRCDGSRRAWRSSRPFCGGYRFAGDGYAFAAG